MSLLKYDVTSGGSSSPRSAVRHCMMCLNDGSSFSSLNNVDPRPPKHKRIDVSFFASRAAASALRRARIWSARKVHSPPIMTDAPALSSRSASSSLM